MVTISPTSKIRRTVFKFLLKVIYILLDNTGDSKPERNGEYHFIKKLQEQFRDQKVVLFDVGANLGEYTERLTLGGGYTLAAHLFEPQKACFATIQKKFAGMSTIQVNNFGFSDKETTATLFKDHESSPLSSLYERDLSSIDITLGIQETVKLKPAHTYIKEHGISHINLLKIDVEGHETAVFAGFGDFLHPDNIDYIQFEYGGANLDSRTTLRELHNLLTQRGFVMCKMMRRYLAPRAYDPDLENYQYQNWVAVSPRIMKHQEAA